MTARDSDLYRKLDAVINSGGFRSSSNELPEESRRVRELIMKEANGMFEFSARMTQSR